MILSVQKAMNILSALANAKNRPMPLKEIAEQTGYPKPTCAHLLETLCHDGYAVRVSHSDGYAIGPALYCLTRYGRYDEELVALCRPIMRWMEKCSHATVILSIIQGGQKFIIDYADTEQNLLSEHSRIRTDDIYRTATGRAILAQMDREDVRAIYEKYGRPTPEHWREVTSFASLLKELDSIRKLPIVTTGTEAVTNPPQNVGMACPLFRKHTCVGAIGLAWKASEESPRLSAEQEAALKQILLKGAREIGRRLSYE